MVNESTVDELLYPRYKVSEEGYPGMHYTSGQVITLSPETSLWEPASPQYQAWVKEMMAFYKNWPSIFQPLAWYAERSISEMPHYVLWSQSDNKQVSKVHCWEESKAGYVHNCRIEVNGRYMAFWPDESCLLPATKADYDNFVKRQTTLPKDDSKVNAIREDLLLLFEQSIGWKFRVKGTPMVDTIEGVDEETKMVKGKLYGEFHIDLCELTNEPISESN